MGLGMCFPNDPLAAKGPMVPREYRFKTAYMNSPLQEIRTIGTSG